MVEDLTGRQFGDRIVIGRADPPVNDWGSPMWACQCKCGSVDAIRWTALMARPEFRCKHRIRDLRGGVRVTKSRFYTSVAHQTTHPMVRKAYKAWRDASRRCLDPGFVSKYYNYGGRGIQFSSRWQGPEGFDNFICDVGLPTESRYTLDRIDNDGNYEPGNCRWITIQEQQKNRKSRRLTAAEKELAQLFGEVFWQEGELA